MQTLSGLLGDKQYTVYLLA